MDSEQGLLVALTLMVSTAAVVWGCLYLLLGDPIAAAIPLSYSAISFASLWRFSRVGGYEWLRRSQLLLCLILPTLLLIRLGGFAASGGVSLWSITSPLAALVLADRREAVWCFAAYVTLIPVGPVLALDRASISPAWADVLFVMNLAGVSGVVAVVLFAFAGNRDQAIVHLRQRYASVRRVFSLYVSPNLVEHLVKNPAEVRLGGQRRDCSFVMTDIANFTTLVEGTSPDEVISLLNGYLAGMTRVALAHGGTIDRVVGDSVAVVFSAPEPQSDHAQRAVRCALGMDRFATEFAQARRAEGIPFGDTRIGVNSGPVIVGNVGSDTYLDYRALGDAINTASRLESANRYLGSRLCVGESTVARDVDCDLRPVGRVTLKGKSESLVAYSAWESGAPDSWAKEEYARVYEMLEAADPRAGARLRALQSLRPDDPILSFHAQRLGRGETGVEIVFDGK